MIAALAGIYATRMLGLFLLLPVLAIYASQLPGATPSLAGLTMGAYGLTQAIFQIPYGRLSDRYGRRPLIFIGLLLFLGGSILGALAHSLPMVMLARAVQGAGAMSAAVTALLADYTREIVRTRAMAFIGISIGASFVLSLIFAPVLEALIGVPGIFWVMALLAFGGMLLLKWIAPADVVSERRKISNGSSLWKVALLRPLRAYFVGVFVLHFVLSATFLSVPLVLLKTLGIAEADHWKIYLGVFVLSFAGTVPLILSTERSAGRDRITVLAIVIAGLAQAALAMIYTHLWPLLIAFTAFFAVFNFLEARLPATLSKAVTADVRGAALGVFALCQSLGAASGPAIGGRLVERFGFVGVFWASAAAALLWAFVAARADNGSTA